MRKRFNVLGTSITCLLFIGLMLGLFFLGNRTQKEQTKDATTSSSQEISARDKVIANYLEQMTLYSFAFKI